MIVDFGHRILTKLSKILVLEGAKGEGGRGTDSGGVHDGGSFQNHSNPAVNIFSCGPWINW